MPEDLAWEALVKATQANPDFERGRIAVALQSIKGCLARDGVVVDDWPQEIEARAEMYRQSFPNLTLTPTALARHWYRVLPRKRSTVDEWRDRFDT